MQSSRIVGGILVLLVSFSPVTVATPQVEGTTSRLNLGFDKSVPGDQAFIPLILTPATGVEIGRIIAEITFPSHLLSFEEARRGAAANSADAQVSTRVSAEEQSPENSILEVVVATEEGAAIPGGIVVYLTFRIADHAPGGQIIELQNTARVFTTDDPLDPVELTTTNGEIENLEFPVLFACFFFMH